MKSHLASHRLRLRPSSWHKLGEHELLFDAKCTIHKDPLWVEVSVLCSIFMMKYRFPIKRKISSFEKVEKDDTYKKTEEEKRIPAG